jgi:putative nucleotidyltransferase with HDIG domain
VIDLQARGVRIDVERGHTARRAAVDRAVAAARDHLGTDVFYAPSGAALLTMQDVLSVPVPVADGRSGGSLCCRDELLDDHGRSSLRLVAHLLGGELERMQRDAERRRGALRAAGVEALLAALEVRDGYTRDHSEAVVELSASAAERLGLSVGSLEIVQQVALLHDLGKIAVPDPILRKMGPLDRHEWDEMREHPVVGAKIVASIEGLEHLASAIRAGHERWDGRGYPDGLAGEAIPLASRIVSLCDAYHAMVSDRPYRRALERPRALAELERCAGSQFCPAAVEALLAGA